MAYWCDDYRLLREQRRLDAEQQRAIERKAKKDAPNAQ
jgi:hypothetical protein